MRQNDDALAAVREALDDSTPASRAALVEDLVRAAYDHVKFRAPGGEGLDGRDGPERRSLGNVLTAAIRHHDDMTRPEGMPTTDDREGARR